MRYLLINYKYICNILQIYVLYVLYLTNIQILWKQKKINLKDLLTQE